MNRGSRKKGIIALGCACLILALLPFFTDSRYFMHLIIMTCINIMLGLSFSMLFSAGLVTMGAAGFWGIGAYTSALLVLKAGLSFWVAMPLAALATACVAFIVGLVIIRAPGVAFIIQTMIVNMILVQVFGHFEFFGGWAGLLDIPAPNPIGPITFTGKTANYYLILMLLLVNILAFYALYTSRIGRAWSAIRLNARLAETLSVDLFRYRLVAFIISSAGAGLAGSFYAHYFQTLEPNMFNVFKSIYIQIYSILGGLNFYIPGPVIGAAIITFVPELLRIGKEIEPILTGAVLILLVIFLPGGILSLPDRLGFFTKEPLAASSGKNSVQEQQEKRVL
ncbi:MAG TPA: branched-chain amino acid ABC transporter permease [Syntrophorhabdales bacterium]|nr:branched-chain amino acid ABC transporter permease [Syntrophorhabdales bacterium]